MNRLGKTVRSYLVFCGLIVNIALGYAVFNFGKALTTFDSLPSVLTAIAGRLDYPYLQPVSDMMNSASLYLDDSTYHIKPFSREDWPMVGPNFSTSFRIPKDTITTVTVSTSAAFVKALKVAEPGTSIFLEDGEYSLKGKRFAISKNTPSALHPITVEAKNPGRVTLLMNSSEGFYLNQPHWSFTGLRFIGSCKRHCEHAFHIVAKASNVKISHNEFINYNAAIKVNGLNGYYPDSGSVTFNHFYNRKPHNTSSSVTPINIDHANHWYVSSNIIRDFVKTGGNRVSYGAYIKGGAIEGIIENNLVACNTSAIDYPGSTVGLSIGGGGMTKRRDNAKFEAKNVIIRNNIIFHCNDVGVYVNKGQEALIHNNTLYNTSGIDVRFPQTNALVLNNLFSGNLRIRDNATMIADYGNIILSRGYLRNSEPMGNIFNAPEIGNFSIKEGSIDLHTDATTYPNPNNDYVTDFCGKTLDKDERFVGAFSNSKGCFQP